MEKCKHKNITGMDWPDGGWVDVCDDCGMSRYSWEQGEYDWIMIKDVPKVKKELQELMDSIYEDHQKEWVK